MNSSGPLGAALWLTSLPALAAAGNDSFAQRIVLPSVEHIDTAMVMPATVSHEPFDPLTLYNTYQYYDGRQGSVWYEWTAPRDGAFRAAAVDANGVPLRTYVFEGMSLERLATVQNGNQRGLSSDLSTVWLARQGQRYQIGVQAEVSGQRPLQEGEVSSPTGHLQVEPVAPLPENVTLAHRSILSGPLPLTVRTVNFVTPSPETGLVFKMTPLSDPGAFPTQWDTALWWEWTCPASGDYNLRALGPDPRWFIAKRRILPGGATAPAGVWDENGVPARAQTFTAAAGEVFDIALTGLTSPYSDYYYGALTLTLSATPPVPPNTTRETARQLPSAMPLDFRFDWDGAPVGDQNGGMDLWYRWTAPVEGFYQFENYGAAIETEDPNWNSGSAGLKYCRAGDSLLWRFGISAAIPFSVRIKGRPVPTLPVADERGQAVDLGTAARFTIRGHAGQATIAPDDPPPLTAYLPTGSLWWRWTAPSHGWLQLTGSRTWSAIVEFSRGNLTERSLFGAQQRVIAGNSYLLRGVFTGLAEHRVCDLSFEFVPEPSGTSWETALDLGTVALPRYVPPHYPVYVTEPDRWFRWTAAATLRCDCVWRWSDRDVEIYTAPGVSLPRDDYSKTWQFTAGQTYWLRHSDNSPDAWLEFVAAPLATSGDPGNALDLGTSLPASATLSTRGDRNLADEVAVMDDFIWWSDLSEGRYPVVWCRWQAPRDMFVRCEAYELENQIGLYDVYAFSPGDGQKAPRDGDPVLPWTYSGDDHTGRYLQVRSGRKYWFALIGQIDSGKFRDQLHLEIRPVVETRPPNDQFNTGTALPDDVWNHGYGVYSGTHRGGGRRNPLQYEWMRATLEPGEPPVSLVLGEEGNSVQQTASTWWRWTAPVGGLYKLMVQPADPRDRNSPRSGDGGTGQINDLTINVYTGDSLAALHAVPLYEPLEAQYVFRASAGTRYSFRVASGEVRDVYNLFTLMPLADDYFDYHAIENLHFEDVGGAWLSYAGDGVPNHLKLIFGMDYYLPADHPANVAAARERMPRQVTTDGWLELRCRPDQSLAPGGDPSRYYLPGLISRNLQDWEHYMPVALPDGELSLGVRMDEDRWFLRWDPLRPGSSD